MGPKNAIFVEHRMYQDMLCEIAAELNVGRVIDVPAKFKEMASALAAAHTRAEKLEGELARLKHGLTTQSERHSNSTKWWSEECDSLKNALEAKDGVLNNIIYQFSDLTAVVSYAERALRISPAGASPSGTPPKSSANVDTQATLTARLESAETDNARLSATLLMLHRWCTEDQLDLSREGITRTTVLEAATSALQTGGKEGGK